MLIHIGNFMAKRFAFIPTFVALLLPLFSTVTTAAPGKSTSPPTASQLQTGDLIWPKKPHTIIPYDSRIGEANATDEAKWQRERNDYLARLHERSNLSADDKERAEKLEHMTYRQFLGFYLNDQPLGEQYRLFGNVVGVGHVGIIQFKDGKATVIEAMDGKGVQRVDYDRWIHDRGGEIFWVGRLRGVSNKQREAVAKFAEGELGKPYNFWNFDLSDTSGFYCSKLAWLAIFKGAGFAPDDKPNPHRVLWYSPKQLMHSPHIDLIVNPGNYGTESKR